MVEFLGRGRAWVPALLKEGLGGTPGSPSAASYPFLVALMPHPILPSAVPFPAPLPPTEWLFVEITILSVPEASDMDVVSPPLCTTSSSALPQPV